MYETHVKRKTNDVLQKSNNLTRIRSAVSLKRFLLMLGQISESHRVSASQLLAQHGKPILDMI
jgi:hypothetical protein